MGLSDSLTLFLDAPITANGIYRLLIKTGNDGNTLLNGCSLAMPANDTCFFSFTNCPVGFDEHEKVAPFLKLYPNPSDHFLLVTTNIHGTKKIGIYNPFGQCIRAFSTQEEDFSVDLASLPKGTYFLEALSERGLKSAFFVIQH
jgi:hypothetical protein